MASEASEDFVTPVPPDAALPHPAGDLDASPTPGPVHRVGVYAVVMFLFIRFSRITDDWSAVIGGFNLGGLGLASLSAAVALLVTIGTGGLRRALTSRAGFWLSAFTIWLVIATPFSFWRRGSQMLLTNQWSGAFLVFVMVAGLLRTVDHCRQAMFAIGCGSAFIALMYLWVGGSASTGRLVFGVSDYLSNPNDLAQLLLLGLPFVWLMAVEAGGLWMRRLLAGLTSVAILYAAAHTGSRGMLIALMGMALVALWKASPTRRVTFGMAGLVFAVGVYASLPVALQQRYATVILGDADGSTDPLAESAAASRAQRMSLLRQSVSLTLRNPVFGVGPGTFEGVVAAEARRQGVREPWLATHNSYTQVSSEAGLPALFFLVATLWHCLRTVSSLLRGAGTGVDVEDTAAPAYCLLLSLVALAITAFFSNIAYAALLPVLAGLSTALARAVQETPAPDADSDGGRSVPV